MREAFTRSVKLSVKVAISASRRCKTVPMDRKFQIVGVNRMQAKHMLLMFSIGQPERVVQRSATVCAGNSVHRFPLLGQRCRRYGLELHLRCGTIDGLLG